MEIERTQSGNKINYMLNVVGKIDFMKTSGVSLENHLVTLGSRVNNRKYSGVDVLGVYDITSETDLDSLIFSDFKKYVGEAFGESEYHKQKFSEAIENFKLGAPLPK